MAIEETDSYSSLAVAYVRGSLQDVGLDRSDAEVLALGRAAGLKLHRFKRTTELPRVRSVLGMLRGLGPASLLDIGSGRGVFLWPLLDAFPELAVTAAEPDGKRRAYLDAVSRGGIGRLTVLPADACSLPIKNGAFDVVTALEVLEHQRDPAPLAQAAVRLASRFVIASVPSKPDNNPEHVQLFNGRSLSELLLAAGATRVQVSYVPNHIIALAAVAHA